MNRTYRKLFNQRPALTSLGDFKFPQGIKISLDGLIAFVLCLAPGATLAPVAHFVLGLNRVVATIGIAMVSAYLATRVDMMGKPFPVFLLNLVAYFFRGHHSNGWESVKAAGRVSGELFVDVAWLNTFGLKRSVGALPAVIHARKGEAVKLQTYVPVDVRKLDGHRYLVKRSTPSAKYRDGKKVTTGLQPGNLLLSKEGVQWRAAGAIPRFHGKSASSIQRTEIRF